MIHKATIFLEAEYNRLTGEEKKMFHGETGLPLYTYYRKIKRPSKFTFLELVKVAAFFNERNAAIKTDITPSILVERLPK